MMELGEPYRTLVFLVAVTGLRISEALGLKWSDLDYERQMINLRRVWVGNELVPRLKTDGSEAPVPLGKLLAEVLQDWHRNTMYAKPEDWVFPSTKMKGRTPLSTSMMAKDKIRPAAIKVGVQLEPGRRFGFHNFRHSLATFLINKGKDVKTIQGLLRHAKVSTTLDLYSQAMDGSKLNWQRREISPSQSLVDRCKPIEHYRMGRILLQLRLLGFGFLQDGNIRVSVLPRA
jgi:integrase